MDQKAAAEGAELTEKQPGSGQRFPGSMLSTVSPGAEGGPGGNTREAGCPYVVAVCSGFHVCQLQAVSKYR